MSILLTEMVEIVGDEDVERRYDFACPLYMREREVKPSTTGAATTSGHPCQSIKS